MHLGLRLHVVGEGIEGLKLILVARHQGRCDVFDVCTPHVFISVVRVSNQGVRLDVHVRQFVGGKWPQFGASSNQ